MEQERRRQSYTPSSEQVDAWQHTAGHQVVAFFFLFFFWLLPGIALAMCGKGVKGDMSGNYRLEFYLEVAKGYPVRSSLQLWQAQAQACAQ